MIEEIASPERERLLAKANIFNHGDTGIINLDLATQRTYVVFADGRIYYATDILKEWHTANPKQNEPQSYVSPFSGKVV